MNKQHKEAVYALQAWVARQNDMRAAFAAPVGFIYQDQLGISRNDGESVRDAIERATKDACPGCYGDVEWNQPLEARRVGKCMSCSGLIAQDIDEGTAYALVRGVFCSCPGDHTRIQRYYDMTYRKADGTRDRRHGWYHMKCKGITQTG
jgi:hypothetical protein